MQTPSSPGGAGRGPAPQLSRPALRHPEGFWIVSDTLTWLSGLVLGLSSFMDWYSGNGVNFVFSVTGWNTGPVGKVVFFLGLAVLVLVLLRILGIALLAGLPESLIVIVIGIAATVAVSIRVIWIPDKFLPAGGRGIGLWIALLASIAVVVAGILEAREEI